MAKTIDQFVADNNNKLVNNGGIQCVAVANQYQKEVIEGGWIGTPLTGWATDWWTNFGNDSDYEHYVRVGAAEQPQKGDLAIWNKYNGNGLPHIALVLENLGQSIRCFTQNPGKARVENLTKVGIIGYLRPKKFIKAAPAPAAPKPAAPGLIPAKGKATVLVDALNVRNDPSDDNAVQATYGKGQTFNYDSYIVADGYVWLSYISHSGVRRYIAEGPADGNPNNNYVSGGPS